MLNFKHLLCASVFTVASISAAQAYFKDATTEPNATAELRIKNPYPQASSGFEDYSILKASNTDDSKNTVMLTTQFHDGYLNQGATLLHEFIFDTEGSSYNRTDVLLMNVKNYSGTMPSQPIDVDDLKFRPGTYPVYQHDYAQSDNVKDGLYVSLGHAPANSSCLDKPGTIAITDAKYSGNILTSLNAKVDFNCDSSSNYLDTFEISYSAPLEGTTPPMQCDAPIDTPVANQDSDGDGVIDARDQCPNTQKYSADGSALNPATGCNIQQFCSKQKSIYGCYYADFKPHETTGAWDIPRDCTFANYKYNGSRDKTTFDCVPNFRKWQ